MQTIAVGTDPTFAALARHASPELTRKGFKCKTYKGSKSWYDGRKTPPDHEIVFKLAKGSRGVFFGVRKNLALSLGIPLSTIGAATERILPSNVEFVGAWVNASPAGLGTVDSIITLIP